MKQKIILHACCAPCTAGVYQQLKNNFDVTLFWYNPNIFPKAEHDRRLHELLNFCDKLDIKIIVGDYFWEEEHNFWRKSVQGLEKEPERGKRCEVCYKLRLEATAEVAQQINNHHPKTFDYFGAELSISPHKEAKIINQIGGKIAKRVHSALRQGRIAQDVGQKLRYLPSNFKKRDGLKKSIQISKKYHLYRQSYCGCEFSKR